MPWLKMDDGFATNPKLLGIGKDAKLLWVWALGYSAHELTDGYIAPHVLPILAAMVGTAEPLTVAVELVAANLWEADGKGWRIHDYLAYNPTAAQVKLDRAEAEARKAEGRARGYEAVSRGDRGRFAPREAPTACPPLEAVPKPPLGTANPARTRPVPGPVPDHDPGNSHDHTHGGAHAPRVREEPIPPPILKGERRRPAHADQFDAILRGMKWAADRLTNGERGRANRAASELDRAGYTAPDIDTMFAIYPIRYSGCAISPQAIANNAQQLMLSPPPKANGTSGQPIPATLATEEIDDWGRQAEANSRRDQGAARATSARVDRPVGQVQAVP